MIYRSEDIDTTRLEVIKVTKQYYSAPEDRTFSAVIQARLVLSSENSTNTRSHEIMK